MTFEEKLTHCAKRTNEYLNACYSEGDGDLALIFDAEKYSLLSGGKRIRAFLVFELCKMLGGSEEQAAPFACAVEMVHAYSLIHDDLPCMDDDDYRRGKLTNHKVYGEAIAVLAGDALLTKAFETVASNKQIPAENVVKATLLLARLAGDKGMVGGQVLDIKAEESNQNSLRELQRIHSLKTGAMIKASALLGCLAAGVEISEDFWNDVVKFTENIGAVFQLVDDVLDVVGDSALLGKNIGSDANNQKLTYMSFYSVEEAMRLAKELTDEAVNVISKYSNSESLVELAKYLLVRNH
jgi:geranylgeranyl diphosphate synthase type II